MLFLGTAAAILFYFIIITYSKSAMLMMCIPLALFYRVCQKNNYYWIKKFFFLGVVIAFIMLLSGKISIFDTALKRFSIGSTGGKISINNITTGRWDIWMRYLDYYYRHPVQTLFGRGIGAPLIVKGSHNIYIELPNYIGLIGSGILAYVLKNFAFIERENFEIHGFEQHCILLCIIVMYFFLSGLFDYQLPILLFLGYCVLDEK